MSSDITIKPIQELDGFDGYTDDTEGGGQDHEVSRRVIQGTRINFTNEAIWIDAGKEKLPDDLELIVVDIGRIVQKWGRDNMPDGPPIILAPNQKFPDIEAMNEKCPRSEWRERFGKQEGPWQAQHVAYLIDPQTMKKYTWPTSTNGGHICLSDLADKTKLMRRFRGQRVFALVKLRSTLMSRKYGRQRPDLIIERWVTFDDTGKALPAPEQRTLAKDPMRTVEEPSLSEEMGDEIKW